MTNEEYIAKAKSIHGDKYDYSKTHYVRGSDKVIIICPIHGEFLQRANSHTNDKQGCPVCAHADRAATCMERYGYAHALESSAVRSKVRDTTIERYGGASPFSSEVVRNKAKATIIERFGVDNPMKSDVVKQKVFGKEAKSVVEPVAKSSPKKVYPKKSEAAKEKFKQTMLARYGVDNPRKIKGVDDKIRKTCKARYGSEYAIASKSVRQKIKHTMIERHGVDNPMQSESVKQKAIATNMKKYGGVNPMCSEEIQAKFKNTMMSRYGVNHPLEAKCFREKTVATCMKRYGVDNPMKSTDIQLKARATSLERYGTDNPACSQVVKDKYKATMLSRYGVDCPMHSSEFVDKLFANKFKNNTFDKSFIEDTVHDRLVEYFGASDVFRQYKSSEYPFRCDFYIKSRNLYIELNASWTHGWRWYDEIRDAALYTEWLQKANDSKYYEQALETWTVRDVKKRVAAATSDLNYVVFWDTKLRDVDLWFAMGCPDGRDYDVEYSWLPVVDLTKSVYDRVDKPVSTNDYIQTAKFYQYSVFYEREISSWQDNNFYSGARLQVYIFYNRYMYLHKLPNELSHKEILRAFKISGLIRSYTSFDTKLFDTVVNKYHFASIFDPCAGWGERLLYCKSHGITYTGVDINEKLKQGYLDMCNDYGIATDSIVIGDSSVYNIDKIYDAVVTCPPYGNIEIYSEQGAENFDKQGFIDWWRRVVSNASSANIKYFCFQINQKYKESMLSVFANYGYTLIDEFTFSSNKSSHFTRKNGKNSKTEFESMLVLRK